MHPDKGIFAPHPVDRPLFGGPLPLAIIGKTLQCTPWSVLVSQTVAILAVSMIEIAENEVVKAFAGFDETFATASTVLL